MIKQIKVLGKEEKEVPEKGYYVKLVWAHEYEDDNIIHFTGACPFSEERKDLYIRFLNLLETMKNMVFDSEVSYDKIPEIDIFFRGTFFGVETTEPSDNIDFLDKLGLEIPTKFDVDAELLEFIPYYHDGESSDKYIIELIKED